MNIYKKLLSVTVCISLILPLFPLLGFAAQVEGPSYTKEELKRAAEENDMSVKELETLLNEEWNSYVESKKTWKERIDKQKKKFAKRIQQSEKSKNNKIELLLPKLKNKDYSFDSETGEITINANKDEASMISSSSTDFSLGNYGDVLVTLDASSSSGFFGGHAAIVSDFSDDWTLESFMMGFSPQSPDEDGVMWQINDWKTRYDTVAGYWPSASSSSDYTDAALYAEDQLYDPYSIDFTDVWKTDEWYCSQLVWRAWYEQGVDIDGISNGVVFPKDLTESDNVYAFYDNL